MPEWSNGTGLGPVGLDKTLSLGVDKAQLLAGQGVSLGVMPARVRIPSPAVFLQVKVHHRNNIFSSLRFYLKMKPVITLKLRILNLNKSAIFKPSNRK